MPGHLRMYVEQTVTVMPMCVYVNYYKTWNENESVMLDNRAWDGGIDSLSKNQDGWCNYVTICSLMDTFHRCE